MYIYLAIIGLCALLYHITILIIYIEAHVPVILYDVI